MHVAGLSSGSQHLLRISNLESIVWPSSTACITRVNSALHFPSLPWCILYFGITHNTLCFPPELCINYRFRCSRKDCKFRYNNLCKISGAKRAVYCGALQNSRKKRFQRRGFEGNFWGVSLAFGELWFPLAGLIDLLYWCNFVYTVTFVTVFSSLWIDLAREVW